MSSSRFLLAIVVAMAMLQGASAVEDMDGRMISLSIDSCQVEAGDSCVLTKGKNASMIVEFEAVRPFSETIIMIMAKVSDFYLSFPFAGPGDACDHYGFDCPTKAGEKYRLNITLMVPHHYPTTPKTTMNFQITDESNWVVYSTFPIQVKPDESRAAISSVATTAD